MFPIILGATKKSNKRNLYIIIYITIVYLYSVLVISKYTIVYNGPELDLTIYVMI